MTDTHKSAVPELAQDVLQDSAMDQALEWLITLECASDEQKAAFENWLNADPAHALCLDAVAMGEITGGCARRPRGEHAKDTQ